MDVNNDVSIIVNFKQEKPALFKKVNAVTDRAHIVAKIYHNQTLFNKIANADCQLLDTLFEAVYTINHSPEDFLLIYFAEIDLYGIFTPANYLKFIMMIRGAVNDAKEDGGELSVQLHQIVLSGKKQKLVFACTNLDYFEKLQKYASDCFAARVTTSDNQITVDIPTHNDTEIMESYNKLWNFINDRKDTPCHEAMKQIQPMKVGPDHHIRSYSSNNLTINSLEELDVVAKHFRSATNVTIMINTGPVTVNNHCITNHFDNRKPAAHEWIMSNPPLIGEPTTVYYERYQKNVEGDHVASNIFGPLVKAALGRTTTQGSKGVRKW